MINLVEEQHDVDIQHVEDQPINVLEPADEPPNLDMDINDDHLMSVFVDFHSSAVRALWV